MAQVRETDHGDHYINVGEIDSLVVVKSASERAGISAIIPAHFYDSRISFCGHTLRLPFYFFAAG